MSQVVEQTVKSTKQQMEASEESNPSIRMWNHDKEARVTAIKNEDMKAKIMVMKNQEKELWRRMDEKLMNDNQSNGEILEIPKENKELNEKIRMLKDIIERKDRALYSTQALMNEMENHFEKKKNEELEQMTVEMTEVMGMMSEKIHDLEDELEEKKSTMTAAQMTLEMMTEEWAELEEEVKDLKGEQEMVKWQFILMFVFFIFTNVVSYCYGMRHVKY